MIGPKSVLSVAAGRLAPKVVGSAPGVTTGVIRQALHHAIVGVGPLPGAAATAEKHLEDNNDDAEAAVKHIVDTHVRLAGVGGFATNIGGLVTQAVTLPANITGMAIIQCRMVASIAHLRGYDLTDPRVRNAILLTLLSEEKVSKQIQSQKIPAPPMAIATAPAYDRAIDDIVAAEVAQELIGRVAGKRMVSMVAKRVPLVGGVVGAGADGWMTYQIGRYASRELLPKRSDGRGASA
ncbi:EcsC family protein [Nocardioides albertanoniae]|uniref:EcsC family protein n=1 Tax=Nocardioides albertanoniae TaxID=1175486 RepID=A0A543A0S7_9ACTN|nr:EcsC family protein [Nocardioides albertanoniae]TQL66207.1 EcsC family protein [Nocardioides albertanoniae]